MKQFILAILCTSFLVACNTSKKAATVLEEAASTIENQSIDRSTAPEAGPAPQIKFQEPTVFKLENGLTVIVVENHKLPTVNANLYLDYTTIYEGDKAGSLEFFGDLMKAGTKNYTKSKLDEELDYYGISLYTSSRGIGFEALKKQMPKAVSLFTEVLLNPTFSNQEVLDRNIKQAITGLESETKNPDAIMGRVSRALLYGKEHPMGEYATEKTYSSIQLSDLKKHYNTYFKPNIAYLTLVGDITPAEAKEFANKLNDWEAGKIPTQSISDVKNIAKTEINIIDLPTATQSNIYVTNLTNLKRKDSDFFSAILGNHILGGGMYGRLFNDLREDKGYTYGAYSSLRNNDKFPSMFTANAKVRNEVTDSSVMAFFNNLNDITSNSVTAEQLSIAKNENTGQFALALEDPRIIGRFARTVLTEDLNPNYYSNYLKNLNSVTGESIFISLKKHIKPNQSRVIIVGKADDIAADIKKLGYPVKFYDIWANEIADPTTKVDLGDVSAKDVIQNYFKAIGGIENVKAIKTIRRELNVKIPQLPVPATAIQKDMAPNKSFMSISAQGIGELMSQKFNGTTGSATQMGNTIPMSEKDIEKSKSRNVIMQELYLLDSKELSLENIVDVNGIKAYKLKNGKEERFYAVDSGLLIRSIETTEQGGQTLMSITDMSDYKEFNGVKFPTKAKIEAGPQKIEFEVKSLEINKGITEADFN